MLGKIFTKAWVSPLTAVCFLVLAITGVCMYFHVGPGVFRGLHKWSGLGLAAVGMIHLLINLKALLAYLKTRAGIVSLVVGLALCIVVAVYAPAPKRGGPPPGADGPSSAQTGPSH